MNPLVYPAESLVLGASFGNEACYIRTDPAGGLDNFYVAATGEWYFGSATIRYRLDDVPIPHVETVFEPKALQAVYALEGVTVRQRIFVPPGDEPRVYLWMELENQSSTHRSIQVEAEGTFSARPSALHRQQPAPWHVERRFHPVREPQEGVLCVQGRFRPLLLVCASTRRQPGRESEDGWRWSNVVSLKAGTTVRLWLCLEVLNDRDRPVVRPASARNAWSRARAEARGDDRHICVETPEPRIDEAVAWAKHNTRRVCHQFAQGAGFTNDPPGSILVTRDVAWFTFGADWFMPGFCRRMLDTLTALAPYPDGKIAEYMDLNSDPLFRSDYGLNIADPTPLYLLAVHHHAAVTGDRDWLRKVYPVVRAAADYLLSQVQDGLVLCTSRRDTPGEGQCGWRNVLNGVRITGAVTELQAESVAALRASAGMARIVGDEGTDARLRLHADRMQEALNTRLIDPETGRYRLALNPQNPDYGRDDTLDQIFPLLFDLATEEVAQRTVQHVLRPAYRTPFGLRTVPSDAPGYHPSDQWGLIGGSWPNATAWAVAAIARYAPEEALRLASQIAAALCPETPAERGALVPGQFPEWFDGETGVSKGMALSSWMPPTYVWLVVERLLGVFPTLQGLDGRPGVTRQWPQAILRNLRYHGEYSTIRYQGVNLRVLEEE